MADDSNDSKQRGRQQHSLVPRFTVDLDEPEAERWTEVCAAYKEDFLAVKQQLEELLRAEIGGKTATFLRSLASAFGATVTMCGGVFYGAELKYAEARD